MKWLARLFLIAVVFTISFIIFTYGLFFTDKVSSDTTVILPEKTSTVKIVDILKSNKVISRDWPFKFVAFINAKNGRYLQPGEYYFQANLSAKDVLQKILKGERVVHKITIPEGFTNFQILNLLKAEKSLKGEITNVLPEGSYMPATYNFFYDTERSVILENMKSGMECFIRDNIKNLNNKEILILASIVEKEAKVAEERPIIASVYLNRIEKKMPLQADPTVIYALKKGETDFNYILTKEDLKFDSPYNTYVYAGLPPSPICNPGRESIAAVLNPAKTDFLYFVADGTGKHIFAKEYKEHLANISKIKSQAN